MDANWRRKQMKYGMRLSEKMTSTTCVWMWFFFLLPFSMGAEEGDLERLRLQWNFVRWHEPTLLHQQLDSLKQPAEVRQWKDGVEGLVEELAPLFPAVEESIRKERIGRGKIIRNMTGKEKLFHSVEEWDFTTTAFQERRQGVLQQLEAKRLEGQQLAWKYRENAVLAVALGRATFTLQRRLAVWCYCDQWLKLPPQEQKKLLPELWNSQWQDVLTVLETHPHAPTWKEYLRMESLRNLPLYSPQQQRDLALRTLLRLGTNRLNPSQRAFLSQPALVELTRSLLAVAAMRCPEDHLMAMVEEYEISDRIHAGNKIVQECLRGSLENRPSLEKWRKNLEYSYRNANIRLSVSQEFLNRSIPQRGPEERTISEYLLNRPIYGRGVTNTSVGVRMIPDEKRFRLGFLVEGNLESSTYSHDSVVRVYNDSVANYVAFKEVQLGVSGVHTSPATADVQNYVELKELQTPLDRIPLIGLVANGVARSQAEVKQEQARLLSAEKIRNEVRTTLDTEVDTKLTQLNALWNEKWLAPLARMELDFQEVDAWTLENSAAIRFRLGDMQQPGGYTPRPGAPMASLLNFQIHESAINNFLQQIRLEGKTFSPETLQLYIQRQFPNWNPPNQTSEEEIPPDLEITFASSDALAVQITENQFLLRMSIAELKIERHVWKNFEVHIPFQVEYQGLQAVLKRDGVVRLLGRMSLSSQIACRGVFSKIFPKDFKKEVVPPHLREDSRFAMLALNQCVLQDGWLGVSFHYAEQPASQTPVQVAENHR